MNALMSPKAQLILAWVLLIGSMIGWPLSQLTIARDEPTFTLALSWLAIILGAWNTIVTTQVNKDVTDVNVKAQNASVDADNVTIDKDAS
jgi:hypothetical protein